MNTKTANNGCSKQSAKIQEMVIEGVTYVPKNAAHARVIEINRQECPWVVGKQYLIRTVTMIQVGRLLSVTDRELVLEDASWVASTGRFHQAVKDGVLDEVEPFAADVIVSRGALIDATEWLHDLPKSQK